MVKHCKIVRGDVIDIHTNEKVGNSYTLNGEVHIVLFDEDNNDSITYEDTIVHNGFVYAKLDSVIKSISKWKRQK